MDLKRLRDNLESVRGRIRTAALIAGRDPATITLVAVTKRVPADWLMPLAGLVGDLGENYPQELWKKVDRLAGTEVRWHLIGHLQSNKAKKTLPMVRMIHSVDSLKLLQLLDQLAGAQADPPAVFLQVNTSGEATKHGRLPEELLHDAEALAECRRIPIVGLMTMAALDATPATARGAFARLRMVRDNLRAASGLLLSELSMGMSSDFEAAIAEGSTVVRIGSALFEGVVF
jgi:pyridoxal phosphate enzyme (YggS family)